MGLNGHTAKPNLVNSRDVRDSVSIKKKGVGYQRKVHSMFMSGLQMQEHTHHTHTLARVHLDIHEYIYTKERHAVY